MALRPIGPPPATLQQPPEIIGGCPPPPSLRAFASPRTPESRVPPSVPFITQVPPTQCAVAGHITPAQGSFAHVPATHV